jgi:hypothetical protein
MVPGERLLLAKDTVLEHKLGERELSESALDVQKDTGPGWDTVRSLNLKVTSTDMEGELPTGFTNIPIRNHTEPP